MRHIIYNIVALACLIGAGSMEAKGQIYVGYCTDNIASSGVGNTNATAVISCAAAFTNDGLLSDYQVCNVASLRIGLSVTEGLTSFKLWVRDHLNEDNLTEVEVPVEELAVGWNDFELPMSFNVSEHDTLYCGYDYTQNKKGIKAVSYGGPKNTKNSFWIASNGNWRDYTSNYGPVSIKAGLTPRFDNAMRMNWTRLDHRSQPINADGKYEPTTITFSVTNLGRNPLSNFDVNCDDNGALSQIGGYVWLEGPAFGEEIVCQHDLTIGHGVTAPASDIPIIITVSDLNYDANALLLDCCDTLYYELGGTSPRPDMGENLIEEFTSEECGYAPIGQQRLREAINEAHRILLGDRYQDWLNGELDGYYGHYEIIARHEGYGPADHWRTSQGSDYKPELFGEEKLTFAPAMMVNRKHLPVSTTLPVEELAKVIASSGKMAPVSIDLGDYTYDPASHKLHAEARVTFWSMAFCQQPRLMVCLKQDEVASHNQKNYYPETYDSSVQRDVVRLHLGSCNLYGGADMERIASGQERIGDYVETDEYGNHVQTYTFEGTLPDDITSLEGLKLVGYVYDQQTGGEVYGLTTRSLK